MFKIINILVLGSILMLTVNCGKDSANNPKLHSLCHIESDGSITCPNK